MANGPRRVPDIPDKMWDWLKAIEQLLGERQRVTWNVPVDEDWKTLVSRVEMLEKLTERLSLFCRSLQLTFWVRSREGRVGHGEGGESNYSDKQKIAEAINRQLRESRVAIIHPQSRELCVVFAISSKDGRGRYVLSSISTKKRSFTSERLDSFLPFQLGRAPLRKEGLIEKRKKRPTRKGKKQLNDNDQE